MGEAKRRKQEQGSKYGKPPSDEAKRFIDILRRDGPHLRARKANSQVPNYNDK